MDTIHKGLIMAGNYKDIVSGRAMSPTAPGNYVMIVTQVFIVSGLEPEYSSSLIQSQIQSLVAVPVQVFFMYRIWRFANRVRWFFIVPLAPCILFHFVMGFALTTINWIRRDNPNAIPFSILAALVVSDMTVAAAVDVLLAIGLCTVLWRTYLEVVSGVAGLKSGLAMIQRIVLLTINTGIWTALFTILTVATAIKYPRYLIHTAFCFIISPVYVNMLLANLNARSSIHKGADDVIEFNKSEALSGTLSSIRFRSTRMPTLTGSRISAGDGNFQVIVFERGDDISTKDDKQSPV
ncbi:hypothetical protein EST38_g13018 [Candolleomyces aberdarensis]|uniref:DUF6534 domain-containing protein n=1 Tax=Candolleomyces aberdarensis TaxID=2316362 RepID=A0A4Q2D3Y8_9AGAR|nr:hypothetical protein EST38_g13018 [Candolleomyces aberdarensis]